MKSILDSSNVDLNHFTFVYHGEAKSVKSNCNLRIEGNVAGDCAANGPISIGGDLESDVINVTGNVVGNCIANKVINIAENDNVPENNTK